MKKTGRLALSLVLVACVTVLAPRIVPAQESLAKLVPDGPVFFKTSVDVEKMWASVSESNFWKRFTSLKLWDEAGVTAGLRDIAEGFSKEVGFDLSTKNIMSLLGKEVAVAVYAEGEETPQIRAYVLFRGNPKSTAEEIVNKFVSFVKEQVGDEAEFNDTVYEGTKITSIKGAKAPVQFEYGFIEDVLAFGVGNTSPGIKNIVDVAKGSGNSLADNAQFKKILEATKMSTGRYAGCFYADLRNFGKIFGALEGAGLPAPVQPMIQSMKQAYTMPIILGGTGYIDRGIVAKLVTIPAGETTNELIQLSLKTTPASGSNISFIPENTIAYVGVNNMPDPEKLWPLLQKQWEEQGAAAPISMVVGQIERVLGMKLEEDVLPWVGTEFAVLFTDLDTKVGFPYPKFALMGKIKDMAKAKTFLQKVNAMIKEATAETGFKFEGVEYKSYSLNSVTMALPLPLPITLTPSYGIVEDFLIVGSSADLLKQMIDTFKGEGKDLANNAAFKDINVPAETTSVFFFNWAGFMEAVKATGAWAVQFFQAQPTMADSVKAAVENYVVPIANCLSALQTIGGYQTAEQGMSAATYVIRVKDLPAQ
jgi:hypothetical protein